MFKRLVKLQTEGLESRPPRIWCSTLAAFLSDLNGGPERIDEPAERFPPRLRRRLLLCSIGLTLVAIAVRAPLLGKGYKASDTSYYLAVAHSILHGGFPDNLRPPGYSLLLAAFDAVGANPVTAVVLLQNLIGIVLPAGVLLVGWRFFNPAVGLVAGLLTAASPLMVITEQLALAEYLFGVVIFAATVLLAEAVLQIRTGEVSWRLLVAAGAMFGIATLFRANGLLALLAIPTALLIGAHHWRPALRASCVSVGAMLVILAPWSLHNQIRFGNPSVATVGDVSLYERVITWDGVPPPSDSPDGRLALSIYNTAEPGSSGAPRSGGQTTAVFNALIAQGDTSSEASSAMGTMAREALFQYPGIYLANTWTILSKYRSLFDPQTLWANPNVDQIAATRHYFKYLDLPANIAGTPEQLRPTRKLPGDSPFTRAPWQVAQSLTDLLYLVTIGGALMLLLPFLGPLRQRLAATAFLLVLMLGIVGGSLTAGFQPRYGIMFAPMVWILLAAATVLIAEVVASALRPRRWLQTRSSES
jgi:4-amino-4-deoxy-L-arabinose transferase-like glycosyltransferase